jgi:hypothetical protein
MHGRTFKFNPTIAYVRVIPLAIIIISSPSYPSLLQVLFAANPLHAQT